MLAVPHAQAEFGLHDSAKKHLYGVPLRAYGIAGHAKILNLPASVTRVQFPVLIFVCEELLSLSVVRRRGHVTAFTQFIISYFDFDFKNSINNLCIDFIEKLFKTRKTFLLKLKQRIALRISS